MYYVMLHEFYYYYNRKMKLIECLVRHYNVRSYYSKTLFKVVTVLRVWIHSLHLQLYVEVLHIIFSIFTHTPLGLIVIKYTNSNKIFNSNIRIIAIIILVILMII